MTLYETIYLTVQCAAFASWIALPFGLGFLKKGRVKKIVLSFVLVINLVLAGFMTFDLAVVPAVSENHLEGDYWDIETVLKAEADVSSRAWKRNILEELSTNLNDYRASQNLKMVQLGIVESFSPTQLNNLLQKQPETQLLDVREKYEFEGYGLPNSKSLRYGDLANDVWPDLDKNKRVVVICYSGIRGFLVANLLAQHGFKQVAFIRGGLEAWHEAGLPGRGDIENFEFLSQRYKRFSRAEIENRPETKIDFRVDAYLSSITYLNTQVFNGELKTTQQLESFIEALQQQAVILMCETESECYDARMFAYNYEQAGGRILGYYEF